MDREQIFARTVEIIEACFELDGFLFGAMTDLVDVAQQVDPERLEDVMQAVEREFGMTCPEVVDDKGEMRRAQIFLPDHLTVSDLVDIISSGRWPEDWIVEGKWVRPLFGPRLSIGRFQL